MLRRVKDAHELNASTSRGAWEVYLLCSTNQSAFALIVQSPALPAAHTDVGLVLL